MPIRPIDMQVNIPKVMEIKEAKQSFIHREDINHHGANSDVKKEEIKKKESVVKSEASTKNKKVLRDRDNKNKGSKKRENHSKDSGGEDDSENKYRSIDIKI